LGFPFQSKSENCEGIEIEKLNLIAKRVIEYHHLAVISKTVPDRFQWGYFEREVIKIPDHLKDIQEKKYYKFLSTEEKSGVDGFISSRLNELLLENDEVVNYCVYFWNKSRKAYRVAIIQVTNGIQAASYTLLDFVDGQWLVDSVQRTNSPGGLFKPVNNTLFMHFVEEDGRKPHLRTNLCMSIPASDFYKEKYLIGILSSSSQNGQMPMAAAVMMERKISYREAYETVTNEDGIKPEIHFELLDQRLEIMGRKYDKFRTSKIQPILDEVAGPYLFGFLKKRTDFKKDPILITKGICFIERNGMVTSKVSESSRITKGYIENDYYYDEDIICIKNFFDEGHDDFKYRYTLRVIREKVKTNLPIIRLDGVYSGVDSIPRAGKIIFIRLKNFNSFNEMDSSELRYKRVDINDKTLSKEDRDFKKLLLEDKNYLIT